MESQSDSESEADLQFPSRCASVNLYRCSEPGCEKTFSRPSRLETHMLRHSGQRPFKCDLCDKDFTRKAHLKRHKQINHDGLKPTSSPVKCDQCDHTFANKHSLRKHVKKVHEVKQYFCDVCDQKFHKNYLLRLHKLEHTGDRFPHKCSKCMKLFQFPSQLKRHERIHNGYPCDLCNVTLEKWTQLVRHKALAHTEEKTTPTVTCEVCQKVFRSQANLKKHSNIHQETRTTFHCPIEMCPRWFFFKKNLSQHLKSFHEGKKFFCSHEDCSAKFFSKQRLLLHIERDHQNVSESSSSVSNLKKRKKPTKPRKDKGSFKKPMASLLAGVECTGANLLLQDERRPLDSIEKISEEVGILSEESSGVSDAETIVGCKRGKTGDLPDLPTPEILCGALRRMEEGKHFMKMRCDPWDDSDTDTESQPVIESRASVKPVFNFSKFMKK